MIIVVAVGLFLFQRPYININVDSQANSVEYEKKTRKKYNLEKWKENIIHVYSYLCGGWWCSSRFYISVELFSKNVHTCVHPYALYIYVDTFNHYFYLVRTVFEHTVATSGHNTNSKNHVQYRDKKML